MIIKQKHKRGFCPCFSPLRTLIRRPNGSVEVSNDILSVDQIFAEPHNLKNGHIRFDSDVYQDPLLGQRVLPQPNEQSSTAGMSDEEIAATVIPKGIQTLAETSLLRDLRPMMPVEDSDPASVESDAPVSSPSE